ncbi:uncharacterized protein DFL_001278 [Arthrobotrys flagrans]|uniref:60S ribosomal protein L41 n=1 Tax=Arthrobotrys flagrans TaxID=97331 RepID=A0A437AGP3_ARTFL|nr:hypothetical protein DFL_001278 [Arthrobotrys flagrans]
MVEGMIRGEGEIRSMDNESSYAYAHELQMNVFKRIELVDRFPILIPIASSLSLSSQTSSPRIVGISVVSRDVGLNRNFLAFFPQQAEPTTLLAITSPALALSLSLTHNLSPTNQPHHSTDKMRAKWRKKRVRRLKRKRRKTRARSK